MGFLDRSEKLWVVSHVFIHDVDKILTARRYKKCVEEVKGERQRVGRQEHPPNNQQLRDSGACMIPLLTKI
jgi:hypothetical protein